PRPGSGVSPLPTVSPFYLAHSEQRAAQQDAEAGGTEAQLSCQYPIRTKNIGFRELPEHQKVRENSRDCAVQPDSKIEPSFSCQPLLMPTGPNSSRSAGEAAESRNSALYAVEADEKEIEATAGRPGLKCIRTSSHGAQKVSNRKHAPGWGGVNSLGFAAPINQSGPTQSLLVYAASCGCRWPAESDWLSQKGSMGVQEISQIRRAGLAQPQQSGRRRRNSMRSSAAGHDTNSNPLLADVSDSRQTGSAGQELVWKVFEAVRADDGKGEILCPGSSVPASSGPASSPSGPCVPLVLRPSGPASPWSCVLLRLSGVRSGPRLGVGRLVPVVPSLWSCVPLVCSGPASSLVLRPSGPGPLRPSGPASLWSASLWSCVPLGPLRPSGLVLLPVPLVLRPSGRCVPGPASLWSCVPLWSASSGVPLVLRPSASALVCVPLVLVAASSGLRPSRSCVLLWSWSSGPASSGPGVPLVLRPLVPCLLVLRLLVLRPLALRPLWYCVLWSCVPLGPASLWSCVRSSGPGVPLVARSSPLVLLSYWSCRPAGEEAHRLWKGAQTRFSLVMELEAGEELAVVDLCLDIEASLLLFDKKIADKLHKPSERETVSEILRREVRYLERFKHPKLLQIWHPAEDCSSPAIAGDNNSTKYCSKFAATVWASPTEPIWGSLANFLGKCDRISSSVPAEIKESLTDLEIKHGIFQKVIHGNVSPCSILITKRGCWKLSGLGFVEKSSTLHEAYNFTQWTSSCRRWHSPILTTWRRTLQIYGKATQACDIFSLGLVIQAIFNGGVSLLDAGRSSQQYHPQGRGGAVAESISNSQFSNLFSLQLPSESAEGADATALRAGELVEKMLDQGAAPPAFCGTAAQS
uniref:Protein kinase domain-containing protein n=1 Tax=Macrostomum lignano TaxID=282301 RepID=A0A1I8FLL1_9PLAT